jgi:hypothetical protein
MRTSHGRIGWVLMVSLCIVILVLSGSLPLVSADWGSTTGPRSMGQPPARPLHPPPGPRPGQTQPTATPIVAPPLVAATSAPAPVEVTPTVVAYVRPAPATCGPLTDFEQFGTWKRGDEAYGTFVQSAEQAHSGMYSGKLSYAFPTAGNDYVVFMRTIPMGGAGVAVTAWVYGDNSGHYLNCWIKDAGGEVWSFPFGRIQHLGWQQMAAPLEVNGAWPTGHVSGPANGMLDYPISLAALVLDDAPDTYVGSGAIYIDDVSCSDVAFAPPAAPLAGPAQLPLGPLQPPLGPLLPPAGPVQGPAGSGCVIALQEPANGSEFGSGTDVVNLRWASDRALGPNEYYFVDVEFPHGGGTWYDGTWRDASQRLPSGTLDTTWPLRNYLCQQSLSDTGLFQWTVAVMRQLGPEKSLSDVVVCRSEPRIFKWSGCEPPPEAEGGSGGGGSGDYDLYVRRMDFTPANPTVGQTIQLHVMIATDIGPDGGPKFPASHFRWRKSADTDWHDQSCPEDDHYAKCERTVSFSYSSPGDYSVKVEADNRGEVNETDEGNNSRKFTLHVGS